MKIFRLLYWIVPMLFIASCDEGAEALAKLFPKSSFDAPFPKRNRDLTRILGEHLMVKAGKDTEVLRISYSNGNNLIFNERNHDTIFYGAVCKYRGLYYFNLKIKDTIYWIYAVKLKGNLIYGLGSAWGQMLYVDTNIRKGNNKELVKYISPDNIRLHPVKKEMKNLFSSIMDSISPDTILHYREVPPVLDDTTKTITEIDPEEFEFISKAYPNPTKDIINVDLQQNGKYNYTVSDILGNTVLRGQFTGNENKIDLSKQKEGIYALTVINPKADQRGETIKIIKTR